MEVKFKKSLDRWIEVQLTIFLLLIIHEVSMSRCFDAFILCRALLARWLVQGNSDLDSPLKLFFNCKKKMHKN